MRKKIAVCWFALTLGWLVLFVTSLLLAAFPISIGSSWPSPGTGTDPDPVEPPQRPGRSFEHAFFRFPRSTSATIPNLMGSSVAFLVVSLVVGIAGLVLLVLVLAAAYRRNPKLAFVLVVAGGFLVLAELMLGTALAASRPALSHQDHLHERQWERWTTKERQTFQTDFECCGWRDAMDRAAVDHQTCFPAGGLHRPHREGCLTAQRRLEDAEWLWLYLIYFVPCVLWLWELVLLYWMAQQYRELEERQGALISVFGGMYRPVPTSSTGGFHWGADAEEACETRRWYAADTTRTTLGT